MLDGGWIVKKGPEGVEGRKEEMWELPRGRMR